MTRFGTLAPGERFTFPGGYWTWHKLSPTSAYNFVGMVVHLSPWEGVQCVTTTS